jgi:hemerythrin
LGKTFLSWREQFEIGHPGLDLEHKYLVELINQMAGVDRGEQGLQKLSGLSNTFYFASIRHFRHETSILRDLIEGAYLLEGNRQDQGIALSEAAVNDHHAEHARAVIKLERTLHVFPAVLDQRGPTLASELKDWFVDHVINHDAHLRTIFQRLSRD